MKRLLAIAAIVVIALSGCAQTVALQPANDGVNAACADVVVRLPDNKDIVIDAKVSLVNYERYCNSVEEVDRQLALREHIASMRAHISGLSAKDYENLEGVRSLDFVLIFVPIEAAFLTAFDADPALFRDAYEKNILVVSPTTLLLSLIHI